MKVAYNRSSRAYQGKFKDTDGRWKTKKVPVNIDSEDLAQDWFDRWDHDRLNGIVVSQPIVKTLRTLSITWVKHVRAQGNEKNARGAQSFIDKYVLTHQIADTPLEGGDFDIGQASAWVLWMKKQPIAPLTVRNRVQMMRGFVVDIRGNGWAKMTENPFTDPYIKKVLGKAHQLAGQGTLVHLSTEEAQTLILCPHGSIPEHRKVRNLVSLATGARHGEVAGWMWSDVELDAKIPFIRIQRQYQFERGQATFKPPKRDSKRIVPLHPTVVAVLKWWKHEAWRCYVSRDPRPDDPVFPSPNGDFTAGNYANNFRSDLAVAGITPLYDGRVPYTFHAARRTFATMLDTLDVHRDVIGAMIGHSARNVTDGSYIAKVLPKHAREVAKLPLPKPEELLWLK